MFDLFIDDAIIHEPFSKSEDGNGRLQRKNAIELLTVHMYFTMFNLISYEL